MCWAERGSSKIESVESESNLGYEKLVGYKNIVVESKTWTFSNKKQHAWKVMWSLKGTNGVKAEIDQRCEEESNRVAGKIEKNGYWELKNKREADKEGPEDELDAWWSEVKALGNFFTKIEFVRIHSR